MATAYLNAHIKVLLIYAYKPSFVKFLDLSMKQLLALRALLKKLSRKELGELKNADRKKPNSARLENLAMRVRVGDSGLHWSDTFAKFVTGRPNVQCKALTTAPCIFWCDVPRDDKRLTLINFTDDLAWNGSARMKGFFAELLSKRWDVTILIISGRISWA